MTFSLQIWNVTPIQTVNITRVEVQKRLIVHLEAAIVKVCFSLIINYIFFLEQMQKIIWNAISDKSKSIFVELEPSSSSCFFSSKIRKACLMTSQLSLDWYERTLKIWFAMSILSTNKWCGLISRKDSFFSYFYLLRTSTSQWLFRKGTICATYR